jgi:hypothetical protein
MAPDVAAAQRPAGAPRPPLAGTVAPGAIGRPAPTPTPIGGLRTRPLSSASDAPDYDARSSTRPVRPVRPYRGSRVGVYPLAVADAPLIRGGAVVLYPDRDVVRETVQESAAGRLWYPTVDRPRWRIDSSLAPVQAWRDVIVADVVCDGNGVCLERESRVRAPWVAACRCYQFADALGRRYIVE